MKQCVLLLAEKNESFMETVKKKFRDIYECTIVKNTDDALKLFSSECPYCAVIVDYQGSKTIEFLEKCKDSIPAASRIVLTDNADLEVAMLSINVARVFGFFQQPVDMAELGLALSSAALEFEKIKKFQAESLSDPLTGLYNRRFIDRELSRVFELTRRHDHTFAVIFGDVNRFKIVNDTYGHSLGDILLKSIGSLLTKTCRGSDLICRYGGDEFLILIETASNEQAKLLIERLNVAMGNLVIPEMGTEKFSLSLGQAAFPEDGNSVEKILEAADKRMYAVKKSMST